jgi:hypothetical protein
MKVDEQGIRSDRRGGSAIREPPDRFTRKPARGGALERRHRGEALRWYADEVLVSEGDLIGRTEEELRSLHFRRDRDWLRS